MVSTADKLGPTAAPRWSEDEARAIARDFDLVHVAEDFFATPYPYYHALQTFDPVHRNPDGSYFVTRYADLATIYRDPERFTSDKKEVFKPKFGDSPLYRHHTTSLVFNDPPYHTRVRTILMGALHPKAIRAMQPSLVALADELLDAAMRKGEFDLISDYAAAIPVEVIGNLLRVPHAERGPLREWSLSILSTLEQTNTAEQLQRGNQAVDDFCAYLRVLVAHRRQHLSSDKNDVLSQLIIGDQGGDDGGDKFTEEELLQNCIFLLNAGHETTTDLIGNGVYALLTHPEQLARLLADPGLAKNLVEEVLRFEAPVQLGNREVAVDLEFGGVHMPAGTQIHLGIGAANRDPDQFTDPDHFDIGRSVTNHFGFAAGIHICAGMALARLEGRIAFERLFARLPDLRLAGPPVTRQLARFRGFAHVPVAAGVT